MEFRKSQWTESISSLLRKTEMNLIRIQTPYHEDIPRTYTSMGYQGSFYDNTPTEHPPRPQTDYKEDSSSYIQQELISVKGSLEKILQEKIKQQKKEIEDIGDRLITLEVGHQDMEKVKNETRTSLQAIEKKCLAEIKRIENSGKGFVTSEDLKITTEALKQANVNQLKQLEIEIQQMKSGDMEIKEEVYRITEEKLREASKRFVSLQEFAGVKDNIFRESSQKLKEFEFTLGERRENFRIENEKQSQNFEQRLDAINQRYDRKEEKLLNKFEDLERSLESSNIKYQSDIKSLKSEIAEVHELINTEDIESELSALKKQVSSLPKSIPEPDLSMFASKKDLKILMDKLQESENYKQIFEEKISDIEKRMVLLEEQLSESEEVDIDLGPKQSSFTAKGAATFGKTEAVEENAGLTKIFINDLGDSDSESHGYVSPHTSPMNQLPLGLGISRPEEKKNAEFDFKQKTDLHIKNSGLNMINEDPYVENKAGVMNVQEKRGEEKKFKEGIERSREEVKVEIRSEGNKDFVENKKVEVKHFPVESVRLDMKKPSEETVAKRPVVVQNIIDTESSVSSFSSANQLSERPPELFENMKNNKKNVEIPESEAKKTEDAEINNSFKFPKSSNPPGMLPGLPNVSRDASDIKKKEDLGKGKLTEEKKEKIKSTDELVKKSNFTKPVREFEVDDLDLDIDFGFSNKKVKNEIKKEVKEEVKIDVQKNAEVKKESKIEVKKEIEAEKVIKKESKFEFKPLDKKELKKGAEPNVNQRTEEFIKELTDRFIENEIIFGCKTVSRISKNEAPSLKIPNNIKDMQFKKPSRPVFELPANPSSNSSDDSFGGDIYLP